MKTCESQLDLWEFISFENRKKNANCWFTVTGENLFDRFLSQLEYPRNPRILSCMKNGRENFGVQQIQLGFLQFDGLNWVVNRLVDFLLGLCNILIFYFVCWDKNIFYLGLGTYVSVSLFCCCWAELEFWLVIFTVVHNCDDGLVLQCCFLLC